MNGGGQSRLSKSQLDPSNLVISQENLDLIRQVIPSVMEQLQRDREEMEICVGDYSFQAEETEGYLLDLQRWCSRAEDLLEQQQEDSPRPRNNRQGLGSLEEDSGDDDDDYSDDDDDDENMGGMGEGASGGRNEREDSINNVPTVDPSESIVFSRVSRGKYPLRQNNFAPRDCEGLFDFSTGKFYMFERVIRNTIYGNVIRAQSGVHVDGREVQLAGGHFAIKVFNNSLVTERRARGGQPVQEDPIRELAYQQHLSKPGHQNVLNLVACLRDEMYIYAVLPLAGMELFDLISTRGPFPEIQGRQIFREMLDAIKYCTSHGVAHRDISPENFLMDLNTGTHPILIDFGLAYFMTRNKSTSSSRAFDMSRRQPEWEPIPYTGFIGKLMYAAPELWAAQPYDGPSVDVWSAVVTLFVMLFQAPPWERARVTRQRDGYTNIVLQGNLRAVLNSWRFVASDMLIDLLQQVFRENPADRISLDGIRAHPWMQE